VTDHSKTLSPIWGWQLSWNCKLTPAENILRPSEGLLGQWIKTGMIFHRHVLSGGLKNVVSNCVNGMEDDVLWMKCQEELLLRVLTVTG
jgi:hypothetical protein